MDSNHRIIAYLSFHSRKDACALYTGSHPYLVLLVGPSGLEPPTSCLSGTRSNLLSYEPMWLVEWVSSLGSFIHISDVMIYQAFAWIMMMGFGRTANCAVWSPSALTVHRTVIHFRLCSNPFPILSLKRVPSWVGALLSPNGGDDGIRTHDPLLAGQVLSQLSYTPIFNGS